MLFVSFIAQNDNHTTMCCTHFVESELLSFEDAFSSLVSPRVNPSAICETFGLRVISGLQCHCQARSAHDVLGDGLTLVRYWHLFWTLLFCLRLNPLVLSMQLELLLKFMLFDAIILFKQKRDCTETRKYGFFFFHFFCLTWLLRVRELWVIVR